MAFRQIGIPARKVIDRIKSQRAAYGSHELNGAAEAGTAPMQLTLSGMENGEDGSPNEGVTNEPSGRSVEQATRATESPERTAAPGVTATKGGQSRGELKLIVCNDGRGLSHAAANRGFARLGSRPSLYVVGGHAASGSF